MENRPSMTSSSTCETQNTLIHLFLILSISTLIGLLSLSAFLYKSNNILRAQRNQQLEQVQRVQQMESLLQSMLQDCANFSTTYPELRTILGKYGFSVQVAPPTTEKK